MKMTRPVMQEKTGLWKTSFKMPDEYEFANLPQPNSKDIELKKIPSREMAAVRFRGRAKEKDFKIKESEFRDRIKKDGQYKSFGSVLYAAYNPPWTWAFFRRNEVLIEVQTERSS